MKITFKGIFKGYDQLPKGNLPANAVKLKAPNNLIVTNLIVLTIAFPFFNALTAIVRQRMDIAAQFRPMLLWGVLAFFINVVPHEIIHGLVMGGEEMLIYFSPKNLAAFVLLLTPMSKPHFFLTCIAPSFVLGWLPFIFAMVFPNLAISGFLAAMGCLGILGGIGDLINIFLVAVQVPKGGIVQGSGGYFYWFKPAENAVDSVKLL